MPGCDEPKITVASLLVYIAFSRSLLFVPLNPMGKNNNRKGQHLPPPVVVVSEEPPALPEMNQSEIPQAAGKVGVSNSDFAQRKNTLNRLINDLRLTGQSRPAKS